MRFVNSLKKEVRVPELQIKKESRGKTKKQKKDQRHRAGAVSTKAHQVFVFF